MNCRELTEHLDAYLEGGLAAAQHVELERHLAGCQSCVNYLDSYRRSVDLGRAALRETDRAEAEVPDELVRAILAARKAARQAQNGTGS
jgi:anti-sigma factor RsiW